MAGLWGFKDKKRLTTFLIVLVLLSACMVNLLFKNRSPLRISAVEAAVNLGVYWDANCTRTVDSINWGTMALGEEKKVPIYVRNEGSSVFVLIPMLVNWQADNTSNCMAFSSEKPRIRPGERVLVTLDLLIFSNATEMSGFNFDIVLALTSVTIGDFDALFATNPNVRMIYPSDDAVKPLQCKPAMVSDWTASAFVFTKLSNVLEGLDTQASFVNQTSGRPVGASGTGLVSFGGVVVNPVVKYSESGSTPQSSRAPIRFLDQNPVFYFQYWNGSSIPGANMSVSVINGPQDMFVIEIFSDGGGRYIMLCYGFGWQGTYAAGKYFDTVIYPGLSSHSESWIIVKWADTNGNGFVNAPGDGDTYTVIAKGN